MGSFFGDTFIFDSVPSEIYDLRILNFDSGESEGVSGAESEIYEKYVCRKSKAYYYGRTQNKPLEFDITVGSFGTISGQDRNLIEKWLLGRSKYLPFQIVQDDLADVYFNVIFTNSSIKYIGNFQKAFILHARCDAPWGFTFDKTLSLPPVGVSFSPPVTYPFVFFNDSANTDYLYPKIKFTIASSGGKFTLRNITDSNRTFSFTSVSPDNLLPNETITVDNYNQIITTTETVSGGNRLPRFNKNWFRLLPGKNNLSIDASQITSASMIYSFARKVGA